MNGISVLCGAAAAAAILGFSTSPAQAATVLADACVAGSAASCLDGGVALVSAGGSSVACFDADLARRLADRTPATPGVDRAFATGACVVAGAMPPAGLNAVPFGSADAAEAYVAAYGGVTAALTQKVRDFDSCYVESERIAAQFEDWSERWKRFEAAHPEWANRMAMRTVIYMSDTGPKLIAEEADLRARARSTEARCAAHESIDVDRRFYDYAAGRRGA